LCGRDEISNFGLKIFNLHYMKFGLRHTLRRECWFSSCCSLTHEGLAGGYPSMPCPYCERKLIVATSLSHQLTAGKLRSCNSNRVHWQKLVKGGNTSQHFTAFHSVSQYLTNWCFTTPHQTSQNLTILHIHVTHTAMQALHIVVRAADVPNAMLFYNSMSIFVRLEHPTFGVNIIGTKGDYRKCIKELSKSILLLPIKKVPLKLHCIVTHLDARYISYKISCQVSTTKMSSGGYLSNFANFKIFWWEGRGVLARLGKIFLGVMFKILCMSLLHAVYALRNEDSDKTPNKP